MDVLKVKNLRKHFGGVKAVDDCTFSVKKGTIVGLIGPNGAGKTTVFDLITGFYAPTSGEVLLEGENIIGMAPHAIARKGITRTFQLIRLFPKLSALENVLLAEKNQSGENLFKALIGGWKQEEKKNHEKAMELLEFVGLHEKAHHHAGGLSYGQQKLLEIARCLATEPKLLLLDEPFAGLNPIMANKVAGVLKKLRNEGKTIILVEHNVSLVTSICDQLVVLDYGKEIAMGKPRTVVRNRKVVEAYLGKEASAQTKR